MRFLIGFVVMLSSSLFCATFDIGYISKKIDAIENRPQISASIDYKVYDPFATAKPILKIKKTPKAVKKFKPIIIQTILNRKVLVGNRWYRRGESINGKLIKAINPNSILVSDGKKQILIFQKREQKR
jgi:hypothetical protein